MSDIVTAVSTATPTSTDSATIEVNSGDAAPVSFDELNEIDAQAKLAKKEAKSQVKELAKETAKELKKSDGKSEEKVKKDDKAEPKEAKGKEAGKEEKEGLEAKTTASKKTLKAKAGDKELDLDLETLIPVKINGKEEMISLKDVQSQVSGKVEWDKRFSQLDKERKEFKSKTEVASTKIKSIFEESDPEMKMVRMAEFAGVDPIKFRQDFLNDQIKLLEKWYSMSDAEKEADAKDFENKLLRKKLETSEKETQYKQAMAELDAAVQALSKSHKFSKEDFANRYEEIESLAKQGKFKGDITPEFVAETIVKDRLWNAAENAIRASNAELPLERRNDLILSLVDNAHSMGLAEEDIADMAKQLWGRKSQPEVIQEKIEQREEFMAGKKPVKKSSPRDEVLFFNEL